MQNNKDEKVIKELKPNNSIDSKIQTHHESQLTSSMSSSSEQLVRSIMKRGPSTSAIKIDEVAPIKRHKRVTFTELTVTNLIKKDQEMSIGNDEQSTNETPTINKAFINDDEASHSSNSTRTELSKIKSWNNIQGKDKRGSKFPNRSTLSKNVRNSTVEQETVNETSRREQNSILEQSQGSPLMKARSRLNIQ